MIWFFLHLLGYAAILAWIVVPAGYIGYKKLDAAATWLQRNDAQARMARIAKMEISTGVGLDYGKDWLAAQPIPVKHGFHLKLAKEGNGAVERMCIGCDKEYRPHDEYDNWAGYYKDKPKVNRDLADKLCGTCYKGALT